MSTADYPQAPPVYEADRPPAGSSKGYGAADPLLASAVPSGPSNSWADMPEDEIEDFKYGSSVASSSIQIRQAFIRKVYSVLFAQICATTIIGASLRMANAQTYIAQNSWVFWVPFAGSIASMLALFYKRQSYPANVALLSVFTVFESFSVGSVVTFYDSKIVLQALVITSFVFLGLTLFAMQTKYDLSSMGGVLYTMLISFVFIGLVSIFFPFSRVIDAVYAGFGTLLFSAYILYDTYMICNRLSPDEWVLAVVSLYLDILNLFLSLLRLLNSTQDR
ncbi:MAG: hypothetical protein CYPHOPRED_004709 [Cyphobasidiales sp. Tagirdzhanova-0007]|nr:MAG: hypothetical protein CYPHOPRED_004709 [Cyphobasidiales sp. Tagirdzhanova-0007]